TILATGGNAMVKSAYSCGKPALGVGAGNVPAYVEKSCDIKQAAHDIVMSKSFDNGMVCASESGAIIYKEIYKDFINEIKTYHTYIVSAEEKKLLEKYVFVVTGKSTEAKKAKLNTDVVGMYAIDIAKNAGFKVPEGTSILGVEIKEIGEREPMSREKLSPILGLYKAKSQKDGIENAKKMVEFHGLGHSASIHTA